MNRDLSRTRAGVLGLARSGVAAARLLAAKGATVQGIDRRSATELGASAAALQAAGIPLVAQSEARLEQLDLLVVSPGVPMALPEIQQAREAGVEVVGEVELASWFLPTRRLIGVTGTNGKSTTTALAACLLETAGRRTFAGGNLGTPLAEAALLDEPNDDVVCELSSFQLEGIAGFRPDVAVITNLSPDHIDRYPDMQAYADAKARIFMNQRSSDALVINRDAPEVVELAREARSRIITFGFGAAEGDGARASGERIEVRLDGASETYLLRNRALRGDHNAANAMAAILAARLAGVDAADVQRGLDRFPGLPHRMESAGTVAGVEWVNDSKATNVESALVALRAFPANVWLIAGGHGKGAPYAPLVEASKGRVKGVLTIGEDAPRLEEAWRDACEVIPCGEMAVAVREAAARAQPGDVVLLSPACASFDQFSNFEERGERFKALVRALGGEG